MPQIVTVELTVHWSAKTIVGSQFVGVVEDDRRARGRAISTKEVFVDLGAIATAAGEVIGEPVGRPTLALGNAAICASVYAAQANL